MLSGVSVRKVRQTERIRPGRAAERYLFREWGMCRYVWNQLCEESQTRHLWNRAARASGVAWEDLPTFGYADQDKHLSRLRRATVDEDGVAWLAGGSSVAQQQTVRDFAAARSKALMDHKNKVPVAQRRGLPTWRSKDRDLPTMNYTRRGFALRPHPGTGRLALSLPGGVVVPVVWTRTLPCSPGSVRVYQDSLGHWYASFVVEVAVGAEHLPPVGHERALGIDWGVTETATTVVGDLRSGMVDESHTYDLPHAQHGKTTAQRLAGYQRMMARRRTPRGTPNSKRYVKATRQAAKAHKKVQRQRRDDARKWAKKIVLDHDMVAVEDFKPKFLAKQRNMSRKAADAAIAHTKTELVWMATKHGRDLRLVHPRHTTTDCASCGARTKHRLPLGERTYTCETCGMVRPRDKNSAAVMIVRAFGDAASSAAWAGFVPADAEGVNPEPAAAREPAA